MVPSRGAGRLLATLLSIGLAAQLPPLVLAEGTSAGATMPVANARELAAALIDNSISIIVPTADMEMTEADWAGLGPFPLLVTRNVTLTSQRDDNATWPLISFGFVPDKLQLQAGVYFIWTKIVCRRTREAPHFLAPGLDMLRPTLPAPSPNSSLEAFAHVQFNDMMIMNRGCIPVELAITMASQVLSISSRPTAVPGLQRARTQIVNNCTGVNNTALRPAHQCFPVTNYYGDLVLYGAYIPPTYVPQRSGYLVYCMNTPGQCEDMLETSCVTSLGPVECYWKTYGKLRAVSNSTNATAAAISAAGTGTNSSTPTSGQLVNGTASTGGGSSNSTISSAREGDASGGSGSPSVVLGAVLGGVLGGLALIAMGIAAALLWRRRRGSGAAAGAGGSTRAKERAASGDDRDRSSNPETARSASCSVRICVGANQDAATATATTATAPAAPTATSTRAAAAAQAGGASGGLASATETLAAATAGGGARRASTESNAAANGTGSSDLREQAALLDPAGAQGSGEAAQCSMAPVTPWTPLQQGIELRVKATHATGGSSGAARSVSATEASALESLPESAGTGTATTGSASTCAGALPSPGGSSASGSNEVKLLPITLGKGTYGRVVVGEFRGQRVAVKLVNLNLAASAPLPAAGAMAPGGADTAVASVPAAAGSGPTAYAAAAAAAGGTLAGDSGTDPARYLWEQATSSIQQPHTPGQGLTAGGANDAAGADAAALAGFAAAVAAAGPMAWGSPGAAWLPPPAGLPEASERWNPDAEFPMADTGALGVCAAGGATASIAQQPPQHPVQSARAAPTAVAPTVLAAGPVTLANGSTASNLQWITFPRNATAATGGSTNTADSTLSSLPYRDCFLAASEAAPPVPVAPPPGWNGADGLGPLLGSNGNASLTTSPGGKLSAAIAALPGARDGAGLLPALHMPGGEDAGGGQKLQNIRVAKGEEGKGDANGVDGSETMADASTFYGSTTDSAVPVPAALPPPGKAKAGAPQGPLTAARNEASRLQQSFIAEVEVLGRIQHPNIVQLLAACIEPPQMCLVIELMDTSLERLLYGGGPAGGPRPPMPLSKVLHVAIQVCEALAYLHPTIIHRDLKPGNVLISKPDSGTPIVKLADFGLSKLQTTVQFTRHADAGTAAYMAPETLNPYNHVVMHHVDMYAVGVMLWEMLAGQRPWAGLSIAQIAYSVGLLRQRPPLDGAAMPPGRCPPKLRALVEACWDQDPKRRPAASEVLKELTLLRLKMERERAAYDG